MLAAVGETVEDVGKAVAWLGDERRSRSTTTASLFRHALNPKFVSYFTPDVELPRGEGQVRRTREGERVRSGRGLAKIAIPVPPLEEQERIVAILDKFDALVNDLSIGLPAEIAARRQQYEYYRDKLLTFEEAA